MIPEQNLQFLREKLAFLYPEKHLETLEKLLHLIEDWNKRVGARHEKPWVTEQDVMLITYADSVGKPGEPPLFTLLNFLNRYLQGAVNAVHILPLFPFTSDDGFSVVDYYRINPELGNWEHIQELSRNYDLMFDAVINHVSKSSPWFQKYLTGDREYRHYFLDIDPATDLSMVVRPRVLPLLTQFQSEQGVRNVWTTFSPDQIDLNFQEPAVLLEIINVLLTYAYQGARFIRLDAIGFAWKKTGTSCLNLPETHTLVKIMRRVLDLVFPGTILITETNVPHHDNISYFGSGDDEAQLVYQFPLPPLTLYSFLAGNAEKLTNWASSLKNTPLAYGTTYFNFLASHDGIGMRPTEGILSDAERRLMVDTVLKHGGRIGYRDNGDGTQSPYELNINYLDALTDPNSPDNEIRIARFMATQAILLSMAGVPGIYIHSLLGSQNWYEGIQESGINRRINREKLDYENICKELDNPLSFRSQILQRYKRLIQVRRAEVLFSPDAEQQVLSQDKRVFSLVRRKNGEELIVLVNVSNDMVPLKLKKGSSYDLISAGNMSLNDIKLHPYQVMWLKCN